MISKRKPPFYSSCDSDGKEAACNAGDLGYSLDRKIPLEKEMATHSSILIWKIPWSEEPDRLQFMGRKESDLTKLLQFHFSLFIQSLCLFPSVSALR